MSPRRIQVGTPQNSSDQSPQSKEFHKIQHCLHNTLEKNSVASYQFGPNTPENLSFLPSFNHTPGAAEQYIGHYGQLTNHGGFEGQCDLDRKHYQAPRYQYSAPNEANHSYATMDQYQLLTSSPSSHSGPQKRKRKDDSVGANSSPKSKGVKSQSPRKYKKRKQTIKAQTQQLPGPLSELTKDNEHIEIKDMNQWVNRSLEKRVAENSKRIGYIARPMNSFILYRSAYSERCKHWCKANNHQVVSTVTGLSWPMESEAIRDEFTEYARIEKDNHALANPDYSFRPHKAKKSKKSRLETEDESSDYEYSEEEEEIPWVRKATKTSYPIMRKFPGGLISPNSEGTTDEWYGTMPTCSSVPRQRPTGK